MSPYETYTDEEIVGHAHGFTEPVLRSRRIAIIGHGASHVDAPWDDATVEKWTLNHGHALNPKWDRLFELHNRFVVANEDALATSDTAPIPGQPVRSLRHLEVLRGESHRPVYVRDEGMALPTAVRFPINDLIQLYGERCAKLARQPYFTSQVSLMVGYATMLLLKSRANEWQPEHEVILCYGVDVHPDDAYWDQRACFEAMCYFAMGRGITVVMPDTSAAFNATAIYGYEAPGEQAFVAQLHLVHDVYRQKSEKLKRRFSEARTEEQALAKRIAWLEGAIRFALDPARPNLDAELTQLQDEHATVVAKMQTLAGCLQQSDEDRSILGHVLKGGRYPTHV